MTTPFAVAHRMPHTAAGIRSWLDAGASRVECDVQLADDGQVVVSHFLPFLQIRGWLQHDGVTFRWRDGANFRWRDGGRRRDPSLSEALALLPAGVGVLLDPKETEPRRRAALVDALAQTVPVERGRFVVSTADTGDLARYRAAGFATWRTVGDAAALRRLLTDADRTDDGVSIRHTLIDQATLRRVRACAGTVVAWTVNDVARAETLVALGIDGVTTDRPEVARAIRPEVREPVE